MTIQILPQRVTYPSDDVRRPHMVAKDHRLSAQQGLCPSPINAFDAEAWQGRYRWKQVRMEESMVVRLLRLFRDHDVQIRPVADVWYSTHMLTINGITCGVKFFDGRLKFYPIYMPCGITEINTEYPLPKRYSGVDIEALRRCYLSAMLRCQRLSRKNHLTQKWVEAFKQSGFTNGNGQSPLIKTSEDGETATVMVCVEGVRFEDIGEIKNVVGLVTSDGKMLNMKLSAM